jgi:AbrB family looped-hinge helix DNA binding protein
MERFTVSVDSSGRILIPAKVRKQLRLHQGATLIAEIKKEKLVIETQLQALRRAQAYFSQFRPKNGKLMSEELIEERREEARREREE